MDCPAEGTGFAAMLEGTARQGPDLVFVNTSTPTIDDDVAAAAALKAGAAPPPRTVLFGIHPSSQFGELLRPGSGVDACVIGEPEVTACDLVATLGRGGGLGEVAGLAFLDEAGRLVVNRPREPIADLDDLPLPDWSLVDTGNYRLPLSGEKFLLVGTNRGCPYRCTFCNAHAYYGRSPRRRSAAHVVRELTRDVEEFGVTRFMFWAEEFLSDRAGVLELCRAIEAAGLDIEWVCNGRVDAVDPEVLAAIRRAGCWNVAFGIESGDEGVLGSVKKGITLDQTRHAVAAARRAGLQVTGHVIIGFPRDTRDTIAATGRFVDSLDLDFVQYYCAMPYPGTELHAEASARGWLTTADWSQWEHNRSVLTTPHLAAAEVMTLRRRLMLRWYFQPGRMLATARKHVRRPSDLWALLRSLGGFVRWM
jgi:radical SAM superfamily enzyme YgiQ (UPF0313 family)